jgi:hypothetical protein
VVGRVSWCCARRRRLFGGRRLGYTLLPSCRSDEGERLARGLGARGEEQPLLPAEHSLVAEGRALGQDAHEEVGRQRAQVALHHSGEEPLATVLGDHGMAARLVRLWQLLRARRERPVLGEPFGRLERQAQRDEPTTAPAARDGVPADGRAGRLLRSNRQQQLRVLERGERGFVHARGRGATHKQRVELFTPEVGPCLTQSAPCEGQQVLAQLADALDELQRAVDGWRGAPVGGGAEGARVRSDVGLVGFAHHEEGVDQLCDELWVVARDVADEQHLTL